MRLLRASDVPITDEDRVFRYSRSRAAMLALLVLAAAAASIVLSRRQPAGATRYLGTYVAAVFVFGLLFLQRYMTARFRPSNWLVRLGPSGLFLKFRSYLNYALSDGDQVVVFIAYPEIRSVRLLRERLQFMDPEGHAATQTIRSVELDLSSDVTPLAQAIAAERLRPAPAEKHWYGTSRTLFKHYPVKVVPPSFVQVQWSAAPGRRAFAGALQPFVQIAPPVSVSEDFSRLSSATREQQEQHLRSLDARGETVVAIYTARRLYGYNLTEAKSFIERLCGHSE